MRCCSKALILVPAKNFYDFVPITSTARLVRIRAAAEETNTTHTQAESTD